MSGHDPLVRLRHMMDYARAALRLRDRGSRELLDADEMYAFSVIHALSMIGESAAQVSPEIREESEEIPWADIIGMRHRLIHGYELVRHDIVWETLEVDVPALIERLDALIERLESG